MPPRGNFPARRSKEWGFIASEQTALSATATVIIGSLAFQLPRTILRIMGEYVICPSGATVSADLATIGVGLGVVSTDAAAAGGASLPDPNAEFDYPWMYVASHQMFFSAATSSTAGEGAQGAAPSVRKSFDVKSMRKVKPRESLALIIDYTDITGAPPLQFLNGSIRILLAV